MFREYREKRKEKKMSSLDVSERSGMSRGMVSRFENGKNDVSLQNFIKMLNAIKCKIIIVDNE